MFLPLLINKKNTPVKIKFIITVSVIALFVVMCKHEVLKSVNNHNGSDSTNGNNNPPGAVNTCSADTVYFANTILPMISSGCAITGCHDATTHTEGLVLNSYSGIMKIVSAGNASGSKLYQVINTTNQGSVMPPPPHQPFTASAKASIQKWINQGAKNNQCTGGCDTTLFTYSGAVAPIINNYCKGCHNTASLGGGIDLSTYAGVKTVALNGKLSGSINHTAGYVAMPQGGSKLQDCQIRQIDKWIQAGAVNN